MRMLLQHSDGAVRRSGRAWVPFDLVNDPSLARPYQFEPSETTRSDGDAGAQRDGGP